MSLQGVFLQYSGIFCLTFRGAKSSINLWSTGSEVSILSPRTGRPKKDNPKNVSIKVRFEEDMNNALIAYCDKHNVTKAEAIRRGLKLLLSEQK